jgi:Xaa-Pro aminopeptidase
LIEFGDLIVLRDLKIKRLCFLKDLQVHFLLFALKLMTGRPFQDKISALREELKEKKCSGMVVSMLDEVAWLFNLRGSDIDYNPVFFAYALITSDEATLFIHENKLTTEVKEHLEGVKIAPYEDIFGHIKALGEGIDEKSLTDKILVSNKCSWALSLSLGENKVTEGGSLDIGVHGRT